MLFYCSMTVSYACKITMRPVSIRLWILELSRMIFTKLATKFVFRSHFKYCIFLTPAVGNKREALVSYKRCCPREVWGPEIICIIKSKKKKMQIFVMTLLLQIIKDNTTALRRICLPSICWWNVMWGKVTYYCTA